MPKVIFLLLLAVVSSNAAAEWVKVGEGGSAEVLADQATIRKSGNLVKMWALYNFSASRKINDTVHALSMKAQEQYDCGEEQTRSLYITFFSEKGGAGEVVFNVSTPGNWQPVSPGSVMETLFSVACGQK
jgi:hypothetical protein